MKSALYAGTITIISVFANLSEKGHFSITISQCSSEECNSWGICWVEAKVKQRWDHALCSGTKPHDLWVRKPRQDHINNKQTNSTNKSCHSNIPYKLYPKSPLPQVPGPIADCFCRSLLYLHSYLSWVIMNLRIKQTIIILIFKNVLCCLTLFIVIFTNEALG